MPRGEQRAVILVSLLLILSVIIRIGVHLLPGRDPPGMEEFVQESRKLMAALAEDDSLERSKYTCTENREGKKSEYFIQGRAGPAGTTVPGSVSDHLEPIELNSADSASLLPLPGIGPVFAGRIIRYRNLLGGYVNASQMEEVYGLRREIIDLISEDIWIDTLAIRKIDLDNASFRDLLRHPYLEIDDVKALVRYRDFVGHIRSVEELREQQLLSDSTLVRISSYLGFNN